MSEEQCPVEHPAHHEQCVRPVGHEETRHLALLVTREQIGILEWEEGDGGAINYFYANRSVLGLDMDTDSSSEARAVHRILRAMNDGECPKCHGLFDRVSWADTMQAHEVRKLACPRTGCGFEISEREIILALAYFGPIMERNLEVFESWRKRI